MKHIKSAENEVYKSFVRLYKKKYRDREGLYVIEGDHLIEEAVKNGARVRKVFVREDYQDLELAGRLEEAGAELYSLTGQLFDRSADTETPQGIAAVTEKPGTGSDEIFETVRNFVILDRLQDPGNIGTILRTADAAGFKGCIVMKGTADLFSPKTVRAAAGSLYRVSLIYVDTPEEAMELLRSKGIKTVCTSPYAHEVYYEADIARDTALIIGNEAKGACDTFMDQADRSITLPMEGNIESLNAGVAAAIVMYESLRQRRIDKNL